MTLRIGIAGMRRGFGFAQLFAARKDCRVVAVCDKNMERARETGAKFGAEAFDDYDRFCDQPLDAIAILTPAPTHYECTMKALDAGKHVLCEVPSVFRLEEARPLREKVRKTGLKYMIAENVCYFPCIQKIQQIVQEGQIGDVVLAEGEYVHDCREILFNRDDGLGGGSETVASWRDQLNPIQYSTHELGPLLMILNDKIVAVSCMESKFPVDGKSGVILTQSALFMTAGGRTIRELTAFKIAREPAHHFYCLYGTRGSVETDRYAWTDNIKFYSERNPEQKTLMNIATSLTHADVPPEASAGGHGTSEYFMIDDFVRAILQDEPPALDIDKSLNMSVPGIFAAQSARRGGELVTVETF